MSVSHRNAVRVLKVIALKLKNEVKRLCFGDALLFALFLKRCHFFEKKKNIEKKFVFVVMRFLL